MHCIVPNFAGLRWMRVVRLFLDMPQVGNLASKAISFILEPKSHFDFGWGWDCGILCPNWL